MKNNNIFNNIIFQLLQKSIPGNARMFLYICSYLNLPLLRHLRICPKLRTLMHFDAKKNEWKFQTQMFLKYSCSNFSSHLNVWKMAWKWVDCRFLKNMTWNVFFILGLNFTASIKFLCKSEMDECKACVGVKWKNRYDKSSRWKDSHRTLT